MNVSERNIIMHSHNYANAQIVEIVNRDMSTVRWRVQWYDPNTNPTSGYHIFSEYSKALIYFDDICEKVIDC